MRAIPSRGRAVGRTPRDFLTSTRRDRSRVPAHARAAQRRASPRDVVVHLCPRHARSTRWVEAPPRRRDAPRAQAASSVSDGHAAPRTALVVGAGPAGALAALHLSRLGWRVRVLDANASDGAANADHATVSRRGLAALRDAGVALDAERDGATVLEGAVRHPTGIGESDTTATTTQFKGSVVIRRGALARAIADAALARARPGWLSFERGKALRTVDFDARVARFDVSGRANLGSNLGSNLDSRTTRIEKIEEIAYDLLIGADGAESATRAALEREGALTCERNADGLFSKTVAAPPGFFASRAAVDRNARTRVPRDSRRSSDWHVRRHAWPSGLVDAFATPNADGSFALTIVAPSERWVGVRAKADAEAFLDAVAPGAFACLDDVVAEAYKSRACDALLADAPTPNGVSVTCSRLTNREGSAALVGDAAHAAWPTLGQNADAALETSAYLGAALERGEVERRRRRRENGDGRVDACAEAGKREGTNDDDDDDDDDDGEVVARARAALTEYFEAERAPAARAFVRLCETGFGSGDFGFRRRLENACFFATLGFVAAAHRFAPFLCDAPALTKVDDPTRTYDEIEDETRRERGFAFAAVACVVSFACFATRFGAARVAETIGIVARAVLTGDAAGGEGVVVAVLGFAASLTALFRMAEKRRAARRRTRKGNATRRGAGAERPSAYGP